MLAQLTGARYHVAHISTRNAVAMVEYGRKSGLSVSCETTPHHFALTDAEMLPYDSNYKMKPPLRSCSHRDAISGSTSSLPGRVAARNSGFSSRPRPPLLTSTSAFTRSGNR